MTRSIHARLRDPLVLGFRDGNDGVSPARFPSFLSSLFLPFFLFQRETLRERNWNRGMWKAWKLLFFFRLLGFSFLRRGVFGWISRGNREFFSCDSSFFERCRSFRIVKRRKDRGVDFVYSVGWIKYRNLRLYVNV